MQKKIFARFFFLGRGSVMTQWHNMSRNHIYFASIQWTLCCFFCFVAQGAVRCSDTEIQVSCSSQRINTTCLWVWQNGVERMLVRQKISTDWRLVPWNCYLKASLWISAILWHRRAILNLSSPRRLSLQIWAAASHCVECRVVPLRQSKFDSIGKARIPICCFFWWYTVSE